MIGITKKEANYTAKREAKVYEDITVPSPSRSKDIVERRYIRGSSSLSNYIKTLLEINNRQNSNE